MEQKSVYEHERIHMAYGMVTMEDHRVVGNHRTIRDGKVPLEVLKGNEEGVKMILVVGDKQHNRVEYYDLNVRGWERAGDYKFGGREKKYKRGFWDAPVLFVHRHFYVFGGTIKTKEASKTDDIIGRLEVNEESFYNIENVHVATEVGKRGRWVKAGYYIMHSLKNV